MQKKILQIGLFLMLASSLQVNAQDSKNGNGYTLYLTFRLGYQLKFLKNRFFFEPSMGLSYWPVRTNVPESFKAVEKKWPNYFPWEPGLHFGFNS
ncbi:MAG: hypothetical protein I8H66_07395 [Sphingobacteriia bacterium]|nr:hypothetical protein [Sphingobacteriia bacterium]